MKRFGFGKKEKDTKPAEPAFPQAPPAPAIQPYQSTRPPPQQQQQNPYAQQQQGGGGGGYGQGHGEKQYGGYKQQEAEEDGNRGALFGNRPNQPQGRERSPAPSYHSTAPPTGGYGGRKDDPNRDQLFGNRARQPAPAQGGYGAAPGGGGGGGYGSAPPSNGGYGAAPRAPGAEGDDDNEDEDVDAVKQQIRFTKQESVNSTRRALAAAAQAEETGRNTLTRLGAQGERLTNTKKNLDLANNQNRKAEQTTDELRTLNRSMFAVHVGNPFNTARRAQAEEDKILDRHQQEMAERDRLRAAGYEGKKNVEAGLKGPGTGYGAGAGGAAGGYGYGKTGMSNAERSKYQFEADESDDEKEREIEHNLDQIGNVVGRLKNLAVATNNEVGRQIVQIDEVSRTSDKVEIGIAKNTHKLRKFQ